MYLSINILFVFYKSSRLHAYSLLHPYALRLFIKLFCQHAVNRRFSNFLFYL